MKRNLALVLASFLLVFSLTACGGDDQSNSSNNNTAGTDDNQGILDTNGTNGTDGNDSLNDAIDDTKDQMDDAITEGKDQVEDALTGNDNNSNVSDSTVKQSARDGRVTYGQMLRNGRVHDTDGDLTDMENNVTKSIHY